METFERVLIALVVLLSVGVMGRDWTRLFFAEWLADEGL